MAVTNSASGTTIDEIEAGIYRIHTPIRAMPGGFGFSFNQYLVVDEEPVLFHTGPRKLSPLVREAIASVMPVHRLRWIGFSHVEADESGGMNELLAVAPAARPLCGRVAALVSMSDLADREPRALADGETMAIGAKTLRWHDAPHLPHGWDCGFLADETTRTLFCGDLFTQPGADHVALTDGDILGPSEAFRVAMDYYAQPARAGELFDKLASTAPRTLACMHGSAWRGDGGALLRELAGVLGA
jgi:flavorubredoxin